MGSTSKVTWFAKRTGRVLDYQDSNVVSLPLSASQAKEKVLAHWDYLDRLCKKRFPYNSNLAHEGLLFIVEQLEQDDWRRIRTWQGKGQFSTYAATLSSRLLTDFQRKKQGHIRAPKWIKEKSDPIWAHAYRLLIVETGSRRAVINQLQTVYPSKESWVIEEVVVSVLAHCDVRLRASEQEVNIDNIADTGSTRFAPETELGIGDQELSALLWQLLQDKPPVDSPLCQRIHSLACRLKPHLTLSEEDRLLLQLRFIDGLDMKKIAQLMTFDGSPYKRLQKVLKGLRRSFQLAEMGES